MTDTDAFKAFIHQLAETQAPPDSFNQYAYDRPQNVIRRDNLLLYLQQMRELKPTVLLVAEAPGYRGMRITGVPFSSRWLLKEGIPNQPIYGEERGYRVPDDEDGNTAWKEATSTIVWEALRDVHPPSVHWAAYPYHPHQPDKPLSNRKPRKAEIDIGRGFLKTFIEMFQPEKIVAVGNVGQEQLKSLGIDAPKIRHPAQGGKNDFVMGINELFGLSS